MAKRTKHSSEYLIIHSTFESILKLVFFLKKITVTGTIFFFEVYSPFLVANAGIMNTIFCGDIENSSVE